MIPETEGKSLAHILKEMNVRPSEEDMKLRSEKMAAKEKEVSYSVLRI
jgi:hypothetical protein